MNLEIIDKKILKAEKQLQKYITQRDESGDKDYKNHPGGVSVHSFLYMLLVAETECHIEDLKAIKKDLKKQIKELKAQD